MVGMAFQGQEVSATVLSVRSLSAFGKDASRACVV